MAFCISIVKNQFQVMCDKNCPALINYAKAITRIGELDFENSELKARISQLEKKLENQGGNETTIDTPDASDNESSEIKTEIPSPKLPHMLTKPGALIGTAKNQPLNLSTPRGAKRERSDSNDQTPVRKKSQASENLPSLPFRCSVGFPIYYML